MHPVFAHPTTPSSDRPNTCGEAPSATACGREVGHLTDHQTRSATDAHAAPQPFSAKSHLTSCRPARATRRSGPTTARRWYRCSDPSPQVCSSLGQPPSCFSAQHCSSGWCPTKPQRIVCERTAARSAHLWQQPATFRSPRQPTGVSGNRLGRDACLSLGSGHHAPSRHVRRRPRPPGSPASVGASDAGGRA